MSKKRILFVDDEKDLVTMVAVRLESKGYEVLAAYDGEEALAKARKEKPDLIILDIMMPKMDGYDVCTALKGDPQYAGIPIIMFSAKAQPRDVERGKQAGADAYITKPFEPQALLEQVQELIAKLR